MLYPTPFGHVELPDIDPDRRHPGYRRPDGTRIDRPTVRPAGDWRWGS